VSFVYLFSGRPSSLAVYMLCQSQRRISLCINQKDFSSFMNMLARHHCFKLRCLNPSELCVCRCFGLCPWPLIDLCSNRSVVMHLLAVWKPNVINLSKHGLRFLTECKLMTTKNMLLLLRLKLTFIKGTLCNFSCLKK